MLFTRNFGALRAFRVHAPAPESKNATAEAPVEVSVDRPNADGRSEKNTDKRAA